MLPTQAEPHLFRPPLEWWCDVQATHARLPLRSELRPEEFPPVVLPHLILNDVFDGGLRVRVRLVGSEHRAGDTEDRKGQWIFDFLPTPEIRDFHKRTYLELCRVRRPIWTRHRVSANANVFDVKRLVLPLTRRDGDVDLALVVKRKTRTATGRFPTDEFILDARRFEEVDFRVL